MSSAEDLQRRLEAAYAAIRELDDDLAAGRLGPSDHAELKQRSERHAAGLLKRLRHTEQEGRRGRSEPARPPVGARLRSPLGLTLAAVALVLLGLAVGVFLGRSTSDERPAAGGAAAPAGAAVGVTLEALSKELETEAAPTAKLLAFAHRALDEGQVPAAIWAYRRVLSREPKNAEALTHLGIILYQGGHVDQALARVEEALRVDPKYAHAHWDRAHMLFEGKKDYAAAARALEGFLALVPTGEDAARARAMLAEARRQGGQGARRGGAPTPTAPPVRPERAPRSSLAPAGASLAAMGFPVQAAQAYEAAHETHGWRG